MGLKNKEKIKNRKLKKDEIQKKKKPSILNKFLSIVLKNKISKKFLTKDIKSVQLKNYEIITDKIKKDINILFLSDIHLEIINNMAEIKNILDKSEPDFIILGGDYIDNDNNLKDNEDLFFSFFDMLTKKSTVFAVAGNHDSKNILSLIDEKTDVHLLLHDSIEFKDVKIHGTEDYVSFPNLNDDFDVNNSFYNILVTHTPNYTEKIKNEFDLILSGHTHGGQITLFGFAPINHCKIKNQIYGEWIYKGIKGITSSGVGCSGVPVRRGIKPEIVNINIKKPH